jgi:hypothetical protein
MGRRLYQAKGELELTVNVADLERGESVPWSVTRFVEEALKILTKQPKRASYVMLSVPEGRRTLSLILATEALSIVKHGSQRYEEYNVIITLFLVVERKTCQRDESMRSTGMFFFVFSYCSQGALILNVDFARVGLESHYHFMG